MNLDTGYSARRRIVNRSVVAGVALSVVCGPTHTFAQATTPVADAAQPAAPAAPADPAAQPAKPEGAAAQAPTPADAKKTPWSLQSALGLPEWVKVELENRTRYESLTNQYRARGRDSSDQGLYMRTRAYLSLTPDIYEFTLEFADSRQWFADSGSPIGNSQVNALDILQAYAGLKFSDVLSDGDSLKIQGGRMTMDVGSRRLVARNSFRNTISSFTGANVVWKHESNAAVQAFWVLPVERLPSDLQGALDNHVVRDEEDFNVQLWGITANLPKAVWDVDLDAFVLGLHENDEPDQATTNRDLVTFGGRARIKPAAGKFDFELESAVQVGQSRASRSASDTRYLDHFAYFQHAEVGYTLEGESKLRLALQFDYASGDNDPTDDENNRFDTLYGARRFDYGPTGIFGPFVRGNVISPGVRLTFNPAKDWNVMFAHRLYWLADSSDAWIAAGLQDTTGNAGQFIGHMPEVSVRWDAIPKRLSIEGGVAVLFGSSYLEDVTNGPGDDPSMYVYLQSTLTF